MGAVIRTVMAVVVLVTPGAFAVVLAYLAVRSIRTAWLGRGSNGSVWAALGGLRMRALVSEARAVAFQAPLRAA